MSDYSSMATHPNNSQSTRFETATQRARELAAKLGSKRPIEDGPEAPAPKKSAPVEPTFTTQTPVMSFDSITSPSGLGSGPRMSTGLPPSSGPGMQDETLNEYIRVPDKMVGLIIGRGGEQITRLQAESGCKIQMAPPSGGHPDDRLCTLTGPRVAILRAKELVNQIVNHRGRENAPQHQDQQPQGSVPMLRPGGNIIHEEIILPGSKVGLIIGKSGKTIKQLQEQSGAKMVVVQEGPNTDYEKPLRISGDPAKVEHAKQLVYELLADKDIGGPRPYDDGYPGSDQGNGLASDEVLVPKIAVGVVIGRGGEMIKKIQAESGCRVQFHQERDDGPGDKRCYLQGQPHQLEQARQMIEDLISSLTDQRPSRGGGAGGAARAPPPQRNGDRDDTPAWHEPADPLDVRVTFSVSNDKCGFIIGKRGEVIKQINAQSGAHCELDRRAQGADRINRAFYIRGHPDSVEMCKRIIMEKVGGPVNFVQEGNNGNGSCGGGEYYGGGAPAAWGYNPHWHTPQGPAPPQQQQPSVSINPSTGQPDYSQQWIDYYRSLGLVKEAEAIEQQSKQHQQPQQPQQPQPPQQPQACEVGGGGAAAGSPSPGADAQPDYSAQWADYYRSIGKLKEADAIEAQMKLKQQQPQPQVQQVQQQQQQVATPSPPAPGGPPSQYAPYQMYPTGVYSAYSPYGYPATTEQHQ